MSQLNNRYSHVRKEQTLHNLRVLTRNKIPLRRNLGLPLRGSITSRREGGVYNLYYADGVRWHKLTGSGTAAAGLPGVLAIDNTSGDQSIVMNSGIPSSNQILANNSGSAMERLINPAYSFNGAENTGMLLGTGGEIDFSHLGTFAARFHVDTMQARLDLDPSTTAPLNSGAIRISGTQVVTNQQPAIADATDAASVITQLNALLAALRVHGLIDT